MYFEYFDIKQMAADVIEQFENKADKKDITIRFEASMPEKVVVHGDWQRLNQVMTNLISNAIKYGKDGGEVTIGFDVGKEHVITRIKDDGEGIPKSDINRIFERFYRVDKSRSREKGGTGLGLAIVKHIMEGHNSRIEVKSTFGKGSEFSFKLPKGKHEPLFDS